MVFQPVYMTDASLTLDGTAFEAEASSIACTPAVTTATWKGLKKGAVHQAAGDPTWTLDINLGQDYDTAESLSRYLLENAGTKVSATFAPRAGGQAYSIDVTLVPTTIGGAVDSFAEGTVSLVCDGQPLAVAAG